MSKHRSKPGDKALEVLAAVEAKAPIHRETITDGVPVEMLMSAAARNHANREEILDAVFVPLQRDAAPVPTTASAACCGNCRFAVKVEAVLECHRDPPYRHRHDARAAWAATRSEYWCGEHNFQSQGNRRAAASPGSDEKPAAGQAAPAVALEQG